MTWEEITANSKQQPAPVWVVETDPFPPIKWTALMHDDVVFGRASCPHCSGKQYIKYREREEHSGATRESLAICKCDKLRHERKVLEQLLPGKYLESNLWTLKPSPLSRVPAAAQAEEIAYLMAHCDLSIFLCGPPGTSKTTYACALLRRAVRRDWEHF
jgi:DNA replication protein DnaC